MRHPRRRLLAGGGSGTGTLVVEERVPAYRAGRVRGQPRVDAVDVEAMAAPGEQAHGVAVRELAEADGALGAAGRRCARGLGAVHRHGHLPEHTLLQPGSGRGRVRVGRRRRRGRGRYCGGRSIGART